MIKVLQSWSDIGEAIGYLQESGQNKNNRVFHTTPIKNWDLAQIAQLLRNYNKDIKILDLGCGGNNVLRLCYKQGFRHVYGIDLNITLNDRWQQFTLFKSNNFRLPYHISSQSITRTTFQNSFFDVLICLSVIEHHVDLNSFYHESSRILKKDGLLYLSTDYWDKKINTSDAPVNYGTIAGIEWNIFSKKEIFKLIQLARKYKFVLYKSQSIPNVNKPIVNWNTKQYTFISLIFKKMI
ncbi:class I SAM-dependent methyltransferase [Candidatus Gottesmanbacteria bacterium]|nr:class I SAM-dependent methyltransferase [Candidatus Gottesmanbacteria bacterium]